MVKAQLKGINWQRSTVLGEISLLSCKNLVVFCDVCVSLNFVDMLYEILASRELLLYSSLVWTILLACDYYCVNQGN